MRHLLLTLVTMLFACAPDNETQAETLQTPKGTAMNITIDGQTRTIVLEDNAATRELTAALQQAPITYQADEYGGFEKVGALGRSLPTSDQRITTQAGDIVLYNGNQLVLFYGSNQWSYTLIGHIPHTSANDLKTFLKAGQGRVSVTLSLPDDTAVSRVGTAAQEQTAYTPGGRKAESTAKGITVRKGKKFINRR